MQSTIKLALVYLLFSTTTFSEDFPKRITVFGVQLLGSETLPEDKFLHAARIMAQYLDNNEDGTADNVAVVNKLIEVNATLMMYNTEAEEETGVHGYPEHDHVQNLWGSEVHPEFNSNSANDEFDASLEEVLHLITHEGYAAVYPSIFGEVQGSELANAMDVARGGYFETIPDPYPDGAWYTYSDETCEYNCMVTEYFYWALTSMLGAQSYEGRYDEISEEWTLNTPALVQSQDPTIFALLTNTTYGLAVVLPDAEYNGFDISLSINNSTLQGYYSLHQNFPNPFNPITNIQFDIPEQNMVQLEIYNIMGQRVRTLVNQDLNAGFHSIRWDGTNDSGKPLSTGMYIYSIHAGDFHAVKKLVYMK